RVRGAGAAARRQLPPGLLPRRADRHGAELDPGERPRRTPAPRLTSPTPATVYFSHTATSYHAWCETARDVRYDREEQTMAETLQEITRGVRGGIVGGSIAGWTAAIGAGPPGRGGERVR